MAQCIWIKLEFSRDSQVYYSQWSSCLRKIRLLLTAKFPYQAKLTWLLRYVIWNPKTTFWLFCSHYQWPIESIFSNWYDCRKIILILPFRFYSRSTVVASIMLLGFLAQTNSSSFHENWRLISSSNTCNHLYPWSVRNTNVKFDHCEETFSIRLPPSISNSQGNWGTESSICLNFCV